MLAAEVDAGDGAATEAFLNRVLLTMDGEIAHWLPVASPAVQALLAELRGIVLKHAQQTSGKVQPLDVAPVWPPMKKAATNSAQWADPLPGSRAALLQERVATFITGLGSTTLTGGKKTLVLKFVANLSGILNACSSAQVHKGFELAGLTMAFTEEQRINTLLGSCSLWRAVPAETKHKFFAAVPQLKSQAWLKDELTDTELAAAVGMPELADKRLDDPMWPIWRKRTVLFGDSEKARFKARVEAREQEAKDAWEARETALQQRALRKEEKKMEQALRLQLREQRQQEKLRLEQQRQATRAQREADRAAAGGPAEKRRRKLEGACLICKVRWESEEDDSGLAWGTCEHCERSICGGCLGEEGIESRILLRHESNCAAQRR